jgi:hypothetical protein
LTPAWILTSLEHGHWVDEEDFEHASFAGASASRKRKQGRGAFLISR